MVFEAPTTSWSSAGRPWRAGSAPRSASLKARPGPGDGLKVGFNLAGSSGGRPWRWAQGRLQPPGRAPVGPGDGRRLHLVTAPALRPGPGDGLKVADNLLDRAPVGRGERDRHPGVPASRPGRVLAMGSRSASTSWSSAGRTWRWAAAPPGHCARAPAGSGRWAQGRLQPPGRAPVGPGDGRPPGGNGLKASGKALVERRRHAHGATQGDRHRPGSRSSRRRQPPSSRKGT